MSQRLIIITLEIGGDTKQADELQNLVAQSIVDPLEQTVFEFCQNNGGVEIKYSIVGKDKL